MTDLCPPDTPRVTTPCLSVCNCCCVPRTVEAGTVPECVDVNVNVTYDLRTMLLGASCRDRIPIAPFPAAVLSNTPAVSIVYEAPVQQSPVEFRRVDGLTDPITDTTVVQIVYKTDTDEKLLVWYEDPVTSLLTLGWDWPGIVDPERREFVMSSPEPGTSDPENPQANCTILSFRPNTVMLVNTRPFIYLRGAALGQPKGSIVWATNTGLNAKMRVDGPEYVLGFNADVLRPIDFVLTTAV